VPTLEFPPLTPSTDHIAPVFALPEIIAVNCCVVLTAIAAEVGEITTLIVPDEFTVTFADVVWELSAADMAVTVNVAG
jgi:hypothetical protein